MPGLYAVTQPNLMAPKVQNLNPVKAKCSMTNGHYLKLITHKIWIGFAGTRKLPLLLPSFHLMHVFNQVSD